MIEAKLDRGRGPVATVLVQRGTLRVGDLVVAGAEWGRVRALVSDTGEPIDSAGPSTPVEVLGFSGTPDAGDRLAVVENEARAREVTDYRARQKREKTAARATGMRGSLEQMMAQAKTSGRKEFPLVIKADVQGSLEAIIGALDKLGTDEVAARVLHAGVGGISEIDVTLAEASGVPIIAFNVRANKEAREAAERAGIEIRYYNIIYDLVDDVKKAMSGLLAPTLRETMLGNAQILEIFKVSKVGNIAGCRVTDGTVERGANVRLIRDNVVIHEGKLSQLKRFKDDVQRSRRRHGMRHGLRELPGHAARRRDRMLPGGDDSTHRCESKSHGCALDRSAISTVMPGLVPGIHAKDALRSVSEMAGTSPAMTNERSNYVTAQTNHRDSAPGGGSQRQLRVGELVRHADRRDAHARRRARSGDRGPSHHRAGSAHDARPAARHRLRHAAGRPRRRARWSPRFERNKKFLRGEIAHARQPEIRARHPLPHRRAFRRSRAHRQAAALAGGEARSDKDDDDE